MAQCVCTRYMSRCTPRQVRSGQLGAFLVSGDEPVGDVVEVVADNLRLRTDSQDIVADTLDQRCLPARRDGAKGYPMCDKR
jgi:hypothetical protein